MKPKIKILLVIATMVTLFTACDDWGEHKPESIPGHELTGEWYVRLTVNKQDVFNLGYRKFLTSTTAAADGSELVLDDRHNFWDFVVKTPMDVSAKSFSASDSLTNLVDDNPIQILISNGQIIPNGAKSRSGREVDSIYFEAAFGDDPGTLYEISGHKRTGLSEDDY